MVAVRFTGKEVYLLIYCPTLQEKLLVRGILSEVTIEDYYPFSAPKPQRRSDIEIKLIGTEMISVKEADDPGNWNFTEPKQLKDGKGRREKNG